MSLEYERRSSGNAAEGVQLSRRKLLIGAGALSLPLLLGACGSDSPDQGTQTSGGGANDFVGDWDSVVSAAKKEGEVTLYTAMQPTQVTALSERFNEIYPDIKFNSIRGAGLTARIDQERVTNSRGADIGSTTEADWFAARSAEGSLLALTGPAAAQWKDPAYFKQTYFQQYGSPWGIAWNTAEYDGDLTDYPDLLRPELKDKVGSFSLQATTIVAAYDWMRGKYGDDFMTSLAAQNVQLYPSNTPMAQALGSGEIAVAFFMNPSAIVPLVEQGAPLKYVLTKPVSVGSASFTAAFKWAKNPNAARLLADFLMGEGAKVLSKDPTQFIPIVPATSGPLQGVKVQAYDPKVYTEEKVNSFTQYWNGLFQK